MRVHHAPALPRLSRRDRAGAEGRGRGGLGPALVPQATLKPPESTESTEWAERAEQRKRGNPSTRTTMATYKIYAESFKGADHLKKVQAEATALVNDVLSN